MAGFTEGGLHLKSSVAKVMVDAMPAAAPAGPYVVGIMGAVAFVAEVVAWMSEDDSTPKAIARLQEAISHVYFLLDALDRRLDEFIIQVAVEANRQTLRDLKDYLDDVKDIGSQLYNLPDDADMSVVLTNRAGLTADKFLRDDFEIWRWTDVVLKPVLDANGSPMIDPVTGREKQEEALARLRFKNVPTLPVYLLALTVWLAAREKVVRLGVRERLDGDAERVTRHLHAVSVRPAFNKYGSEEAYPDGSIKRTATPRTLPENILWRIRGIINASTKYPRDRVCSFWFDVQNWMSGETQHGGTFDVVMESDHVLCTVDPSSIAAPDAEIQAQEAAGTAALGELRRTLERVAQSGSVRPPQVGRLPTEIYSKANYYGVNMPGELLWFEHVWHSGQPGAPVEITGPRKLADAWDAFEVVLSAGDRGIYAMRTDGTLLWYEHPGAFDGSADLRGPVEVGSGWNTYARIVAGGRGVLYGVSPDGTLNWYRHDGAASGRGAWRGPMKVGSGWMRYHTIFSAGEGIVYGVRPDGTLVWYRHRGYLDGTAAWDHHLEVGTGWQHFTHLFSPGDGIIYAVRPDGQLLWYRHESWKVGAEVPTATVGGGTISLSRDPVPVWKGPVAVGTDGGRYRQMFGVMPTPLPPGGGLR